MKKPATTQKDRVHAILKDGQPRTLWMIRDEILRRYTKRDSEAGISARIRDLRADGLTIPHQPYKKGPAHEYWIKHGVRSNGKYTVG